MPNYGISRQERIYLLSETTFGTIPTVTNSNACRTMPGSMLTATVANYPRPDKTGTRSQVIGIPGRKAASWSVTQSLAGNGTAGTTPDCSPILRALFGIVGGSGTGEAIVGGTSVTYTLVDPVQPPSMSLFSFRTPTTLSQRIVEGAVCSQATFTLGQNIATWTANGTGIWCLDSGNFSVADATQKGGLGAFPTEPSAPVTNGQSTVGFTGSAIFDSQPIVEIQTATIRFTTGSAIVTDTFGSYYPTTAAGTVRSVGISFTAYDDDGAGLADLKAKALTQTPITIALTIGTIAGNIWGFTMNNVQLAVPTYDDSRNRYMLSFGESLAHATSITTKDEISLLLT
jgi:hypothetical protein